MIKNKTAKTPDLTPLQQIILQECSRSKEPLNVPTLEARVRDKNHEILGTTVSREKFLDALYPLAYPNDGCKSFIHITRKGDKTFVTTIGENAIGIFSDLNNLSSDISDVLVNKGWLEAVKMEGRQDQYAITAKGAERLEELSLLQQLQEIINPSAKVNNRSR